MKALRALDLLIKDIRFFEADSSLTMPIADATHNIPLIKFLITEIELASGIIGQGFILAFHYSRHAIQGALKDLSEIIKSGYQVNETGRLSAEYARQTEYFGQQGLLKWPLASVNIAMWDAWGKFNKQPVWKLLGGHSQKTAVYGSGGWLSYSQEQLIDEVKNYRKRGFTAVKIKVGHPDADFDIERLSKVREAIGREMHIMMDANQGLDISSAIKLARAAENLDIRWFEEPVDHKDYQGYREIKSQTSVSLAMGEREYDLTALKILSGYKAIDMWQPDIGRLGGVEAWLESAHYANAQNIAVLPHFYKEYDIHLMCTVKNKVAVESFDWINEMVDKPLEIKNGFLSPPHEAGWGFCFLYDKMRPLQI